MIEDQGVGDGMMCPHRSPWGFQTGRVRQNHGGKIMKIGDGEGFIFCPHLRGFLGVDD
jgi:hypothetical protein